MFIKRLRKYLTDQLPVDNLGNIVPRSYVLPLDPFLTGYSRFARKAGNYISCLLPDNQTTTAAVIQNQTNTFVLTDNLPIVVGSIIRMNSRERFSIETYDPTTKTGTFNELAEIEYAEGTLFELYAVPITLLGAIASGATTAIVSSDYKIFAGDIVLFNVFEDNIYAFNEIKVTNKVTVGGGPYNITLTLETPVDLDYSLGATLYLKAYPAYESKILPLPDFFNKGGVQTLFLADHMSGALTDTAVYEEQFNLYIYDSIMALMDTRLDAGKNIPIQWAELHQSVPMFWKLWNADVKRAKNTIFIKRKESTGYIDFRHCQLLTDLVPALPVGTMWIIPITAVETVSIKYQLYPNAWSLPQTFLAGTSGFLTINHAAGVPASMLRLTFEFADTGQEPALYMGIWVPTQEARLISYELVGRTFGGFSWSSSGVLLKPYFLDMRNLEMSLNKGHKLNSGSCLGGF